MRFRKVRLAAWAAATAVLTLSLAPVLALPAAAHAVDYSYSLESDKVKVGFGDDGSIQSLKIANDLYDTQYVMNPDVAKDQGAEPNAKYRQWLGNVMFSYQFGDGTVDARGVGGQAWKTAWTTQSSDARTVSEKDGKVTVTYAGSQSAEGIAGFTVTETYSLDSSGNLLWEQKVTNTSQRTLVIGDWGIPIPTNELWNSGGQIYEDRALTHSYVGGDGSYVTLERASGQGPYLMMSTDTASGFGFEYQDRWRTEEVGDTTWAWNANREGSNIRGLNVYYAHSMAIQKTGRGYLDSTSLSLAPNDSKTYSLHISKVDDDAQRHDTMFAQGSLDSAVVPGMVVPFDQPAEVAFRVKGDITSVTARNRNDLGSASPTDPAVTFSRDNGDYHIYRVDFQRSQLGANDVIVNYTVSGGAQRQTILQFDVIDNVGDALDAHAQFMVDKTQWTPADNLPAGDVRLYTFDDWMMNASDGSVPRENNPPQGRRNAYAGYWGLGDDWGLPHAEFLAGKLAVRPDAAQAQALDNYLNVAVWQTLMGNTDPSAPPKYTVYDFWEQGKPGDLNTTPGGRGFAYPHVYNTFLGMYQLAKQNPDLIAYAHPAAWYLERAYGIFKNLYDGPVGYNWNTGLMGELSTPALIDALRTEKMTAQANDVVRKMQEKYSNFSQAKYPYGSEYSYDNTGEEAVYTLARMEVNDDASNALRIMRDIVSKTEAARGRQPVWYWNSTPVTITGENWWQFQYSTSLVGSTMDDYINHSGALETGPDQLTPARRAELQRLNYASKLGMLASINSGQIDPDPRNIGASAWSYQAERGNLGTLGLGGGTSVKLLNGWRGMTGESDLGLWGAVQTLSADVVTDDPIFGTVGYGAKVTSGTESVDVQPTDGLQRRLNMVTQQLSADFETDSYVGATIQKDNGGASFEVASTRGAPHEGTLQVSGLATGTYSIQIDGISQGKVNVYPSPGLTLQPPTEVAYSAPAAPTFALTLAKTSPDANKAPVVSAGDDQSGLTAGLDDIVLSGSATDDHLGAPNGTLSLKWSVVSAPQGAQVKIDNDTQAQTRVTYDKPGHYEFRLTASDGELESSDTVAVDVEQSEPLPEHWVRYSFDSSSNNVVHDDSGNGNDLALNGAAKIRQDGDASVMYLDGSSNTYAKLPDDILSRSKDLTIGMRVKLDRSGTFDRLLDFGNGTQRYMFLTPRLGPYLGLAITTKGNGAETHIDTNYEFPTDTWVTVMVTFADNGNGTTTGTIYANGTRVGQNPAMPIAPKDLGRTASNYLGKSQFPDPYLAGSFDSFYIDGVARTTDGSEPKVPAAPVPTVADNDVTLAWDAPNPGGHPITGYEVAIVNASDGSVVRTQLVTESLNDHMTTTVSGLEKGDYAAKVRAINEGGSSAFSDLSRPFTVAVAPKGLPENWVSYSFDSSPGGKVPDESGNGNDLTLKGSAVTATDGDATVLRLDGSADTYGQLPAGILTNAHDLTLDMRVKLDRADVFSRIFDFGNDTQRYMFLSPKFPDGTVGFAITKAGNGAETRINTQYRMPLNTWVDLKLTFVANDGAATTTGSIYADGVLVGQNTAMPLAPRDMGATSANYLGKSQWPDPLMVGRFDTFAIHGATETPAPQAPAAPAVPTVTVAGNSAHVSWAAPSDGGSPISSYEVAVTPTGSSSPTITQKITAGLGAQMSTDVTLTPGSYTVSVSAINAVGASEPSGASASFDIVAPPTPRVTLSGAPTVGGRVTVAGSGFPGDTDGTIEIHSDAVRLANVHTSASGAFEQTVTVPDSLAAGDHTIVVTVGTASVSLPVRVGPPASNGSGGNTAVDGAGNNGAGNSSGARPATGLATTGGFPPYLALFIAVLGIAAGGGIFLRARRPHADRAAGSESDGMEVRDANDGEAP